VCATFGLSDKRLAAAIAKDATLPVINNGRYQIFPKAAFEGWYEAAAKKRLNLQAPEYRSA
jgi:hypothetical protein